MKKVARLRLSPNNSSGEMMYNQQSLSHSSNSEPIVRTTGRIKKPKAVFDPSDNYLPRSQRGLVASTTSYLPSSTTSSLERRASYTKSTTVSPIGATENKDACTVCKKKISKRPLFATKNPLITCQECQRKIHKQCLRFDYEDFENLQRNYKCDQCSTCIVCKDKFTNDEEIITCSKCIKSFHLICFPSEIEETDNMRNWKCNKCQAYNQITNSDTLPVKKIREIIGDGEPSTVANSEKQINSSPEKSTAEESKSSETIQSPACSSEQKESPTENKSTENVKTENSASETDSPPDKRKKESNQSPDSIISTGAESVNTLGNSDSTARCYSPNDNFDEIPDVKKWSVDQVHDYFYRQFPKEAHIFKTEEIDGRSLLLLKRSDVVKKLPIKLGPSLRIYSLILKIQAQCNDPSLGWHCDL